MRIHFLALTVVLANAAIFIGDSSPANALEWQSVKDGGGLAESISVSQLSTSSG
jgi:hypothetical protein